ncbi:hypothetical protein OG279_26190 [Streptomyces sp. NBC_01201]|uniref:hypothetical protein n=1 Tax=unclassified Streptomyces TaxID=2593676 RepID=UPI002E158673|nr:hypothetical protein OG725_24440 [Streptomyces sp. NBC_01213]WSQ82777.1 hypothetical protein OG725_37385 [Streptomyces sp. NBC_01213]WSR50910.1 hypothetical protein OG279_26190 [Streptomyces sp. NBC_01201]
MTTPTTTKTARAKKRRQTIEKKTVPSSPARGSNPRIRWALYNATAAGAGHLTIWAATGDPLAGVDLMARMTISVPQLAAAGLTLVAAYAGWKGAALVQLHRLPGVIGLAARPVAALVAALWGQGTAPFVRDALDAVEPWGTALSPLLAVGPVAAACWYGLDRRAAAAHLIPPVRWVLRIPLATVVVSSLIYGPGAVL